MKQLLRWSLLALPFLFPLSLQAKPDEEHGQEKTCFCHNVNHNPHTICTANPALIQAHMAHVDGEVPGVQDSLGECESDPEPSTPPEEGGGEGGEDGDPGDGDEEGESPNDAEDGGEETPDDPGEDEDSGGDPKDAAADGQTLDEGGEAGTGGEAQSFMEGSGCSLNATAGGGSGGALTWALMAIFPLLWRGRR